MRKISIKIEVTDEVATRTIECDLPKDSKYLPTIEEILREADLVLLERIACL
jgi:hypothetical protein